MKFKKGDWVTIIKNEGVKSFDKFIGKTFPIIEIFPHGHGAYGLPITPEIMEPPKIDLNVKFPSDWSAEELRKATKKEIKKAKKELCIEAL